MTMSPIHSLIRMLNIKLREERWKTKWRELKRDRERSRLLWRLRATSTAQVEMLLSQIDLLEESKFPVPNKGTAESLLAQIEDLEKNIARNQSAEGKKIFRAQCGRRFGCTICKPPKRRVEMATTKS